MNEQIIDQMSKRISVLLVLNSKLTVVCLSLITGSFKFQIFAAKEIAYYGQPIAAVVAGKSLLSWTGVGYYV